MIPDLFAPAEVANSPYHMALSYSTGDPAWEMAAFFGSLSNQKCLMYRMSMSKGLWLIQMIHEYYCITLQVIVSR